MQGREQKLSEVHQGAFGPLDRCLYRSGFVISASSFVIAVSAAFLPDNFALIEIIEQNLDLFYLIGAAGLGLSLYLIHIYVTEIKQTLQALWALGVVGSLATYVALAQPAGKNLVQYVLENPTAVWFVGPFFAVLTGLVFKKGLCCGKLEASILTFVIPTVLLGHLGLMDDGVKLNLLGSRMTLFVIFAGRKFTQPIKDDIGDKSVFMFNYLPEDDEKKALIDKLQQQKLQSETLIGEKGKTSTSVSGQGSVINLAGKNSSRRIKKDYGYNRKLKGDPMKEEAKLAN
ncbi:uncharacterized protein LOC111298244 [Durio zibethinus]|uniref:Uncharacterized protein LOC111298244 n=1 Tax=Durio zibethinus TaxID=66656 RepID=A0A6P5Z8N6_DURZI|nr:uncharacterized protein LOC111298244 [Durio zibethinus]